MSTAVPRSTLKVNVKTLNVHKMSVKKVTTQRGPPTLGKT